MRLLRRTLPHLSEEGAREVRHLLELREQNITLVEMRDGSIRLYFWCRTKEAIKVFLQWFASGRLQAIIEEWITDFLKSQDRISVTLMKDVRQIPG